MTSTVFTDFQPPAINAAWLNDVNGAVYNTLPDSINYNDPLTGTASQTMQDLVDGQEVSLFRFIPVALQEAIVAGTSSVDLTAYFQAAIDSVSANKRGCLFIPAGTYNINQITISSAIKITGSGSQTVLVPIGVFANTRMVYINHADDVEISCLSINASRVSYPTLNCILAETCADLHLHDITMPNAGGTGIFTLDNTDGVLDRVFISEAQQLGIYHVRPIQVLTRACIVRGVYTVHGIQLFDGFDSSVVDCSTSNTNQFGLSLYNMTRAKVINHRSFDTKIEGINLLDSSYCDVINPTLYWTGNVTWASEDFGISMWGELGSCQFNRVLGGTIISSRKSGLALADNCQYNSVIGLTVVNPNSLNEAQGAGVLMYGSGVKNNTISEITTYASNGFMRYSVFEQNSGGAPTLNHVANITSNGATIAPVTVGATTTYVTVPGSGTLATLAGTETLTNKTLSGPSVSVTGAVSGASVSATGSILSSGTSAGVGYAVGARGTVTQLTSKSTAVVLNNVAGTITMNAASLASGASVFFTVNNNTVAATDIPVIVKGSGGAAQSYFIGVDNRVAGAFTIIVTNTTAGPLSQAVTIDFAVIKA